LLLVACTDATNAVDADSKAHSDTDTMVIDSEPNASVDTDLVTPPSTLQGACLSSEHLGGFRIEEGSPQSYLAGAVRDGVVPDAIETEIYHSGLCTLRQPPRTFCDPACDPGFVCNLTNTCVPYPTGIDLGQVSVRGDGVSWSIAPTDPGPRYDLVGPDPLVPAHTWVMLTAATGGAGGPLYGVGPEPLILGSTDWPLDGTDDLLLSWTPPSDASTLTDVTFTLLTNQHGVRPVTLRCELPDTGTAAIPRSALDQLLALGVSGVPSAFATRRSADSVQAEDGCIDFQIRRTVRGYPSLGGRVACVSDVQCPTGTTCDGSFCVE
jgi:hypothetical protein